MPTPAINESSLICERGGDCGFDVEEEVVVDLIIDSGGGGGGGGGGDGDGDGAGGDDCGDGSGHGRDLDDVNDIPIIDQFDSNDALGHASSCGDCGFGIDVNVVVTTTAWVVPRCTCKGSGSGSGSGSGGDDFGGVKVGEVGWGCVGLNSVKTS
ncbi:Hypothetical predicted protein [Olea europaea subsp. europaea]|uniref:Uncharacterized protein n=1 Tax=Olea europaea subsp. europaea TaxID=158383 RepID=A0A8S0UE05_OLEEU|nr:Hypothetical predicted protein [Olea europaea subsp. europaea]